MTELIFKIQTVQSKIIKVLFEVLKEVLVGTVNLVVSPDGIYLKQLNANGKSIVYLKLLSENFEEFICNKDQFIVGIDTHNIYKITKSIQNKDIITLSVLQNNPNKLILSRVNTDTECEYLHSINLCQVPYTDFIIEEIEYHHSLTLKSTEFQTACKNLNNLNCDILSINFMKNCIVLESNNEFSETAITIKQQMEENIKVNCFKKTNIINQGSYILQYILLFTKATTLDKNFDIYLNPERPLTLSYAVGELGTLDFMLYPVEIESDTEE